MDDSEGVLLPCLGFLNLFWAGWWSQWWIYPFERPQMPFDPLDAWKNRFEPSSTCSYLTTRYRFGPNIFGLFLFGSSRVCGLGNRYKTLTIPGVGSEIYIQAIPWTIRGWSLQESNWKMTGPWLITRPEVVVWNVVSKCCVVLIFFSCRWRTHREGKTGTSTSQALCRTGGCSM